MYVLRAAEMTKACVYDKTRHCSWFSKGAGSQAMTEVMDKAAISRRLQCTNTLDFCMMTFYHSAIGIIQGEMMMTNLSKIRDEVTRQVRKGKLSVLCSALQLYIRCTIILKSNFI